MNKSNITNICSLDKQIFKRIEYLLHFQNSEKEQDIKVIIQWIEHFTHYFHLSYFTPITMAHFFDVIHSISIKHPQIKNNLECFFETNQKITQSILEKSYELLFSAKIRELISFMRGSVLLLKGNTLSNQWKTSWFECSKIHLNSANYLDLYTILNVLDSAQEKPNQDWMKCWEIQCELCLLDFHQDPNMFLSILISIDHLSIDLNAVLKENLIQNTLIYLDYFSNSKHIFMLSEFFKLPEIHTKKYFLTDWFNLTEKLIRDYPEQYLKHICLSFLLVQKLQDHAPQHWVDLCLKTCATYFDNLTENDISRCLYALALMQKHPQNILPFLELCALKIKKEINSSILENGIYDQIKNFTLGQFYFKSKGFDLGFEIQNTDLYLKNFKQKQQTSYTETTILDFLNQFKDIDVIQEYWIPEIADTVDFAIQTKNGLKLVEYDGPHHEVNGTINRLTQLKTYLLQSYGYDLLRIHHRDTMNIGSILKEYLNLKGDHQYVFYRQNQTVESTIS